MHQIAFGSPLRKALKSRTASDLFVASDAGASPVKIYERPFTKIRFALNWHASPDST
jgi:hypothetical protein